LFTTDPTGFWPKQPFNRDYKKNYQIFKNTVC